MKQILEQNSDAIREAGIPWPTGDVTDRFEYDDRAVFNEDSGQPTSIDLAISGEEIGRIFIEAKLVEREFGGCSVFSGGDCDERNPAFLKVSTDVKESGLWPFLMESVPEEYAHRIGRVTIQQLVSAIDESGRHHNWIDEFKQKYGIA